MKSYLEDSKANFDPLENNLYRNPQLDTPKATVCALYPCLLESSDILHCNFSRCLQEGSESAWVVK